MHVPIPVRHRPTERPAIIFMFFVEEEVLPSADQKQTKIALVSIAVAPLSSCLKLMSSIEAWPFLKLDVFLWTGETDL